LISVRIFVFTIALVFTAAIGVGTVLDFERNGVTAIGVLSALLFGVIMIGVVGALGPPRK
jgi:hypothetical protein